MFDEVSRTEELEKINYQPTSWNRVETAERASPHIIPMPDMKRKEEESLVEEAAKKSGGLFSEVLSVVDYIRTMVKKNEEILILAIILLVIADSDDNIELLIALAILFLPSISGPLGGLFKK